LRTPTLLERGFRLVIIVVIVIIYFQLNFSLRSIHELEFQLKVFQIGLVDLELIQNPLNECERLVACKCR